MNLFFSNQIQGGLATLDESESYHCVKVLRMKTGDTIHLIDGTGGYYTGVLQSANIKACEIVIHNLIKDFEKRAYYLHIAIAPTKNIDRMEWFVEKATEIGIDKITPLICDHSERKTLRTDRLEKIVMSAAKQSVKAWIPEIGEPEAFSNFLGREHSSYKCIAYCGEGERKPLIFSRSAQSSYLLLIGPEGDFSGKEINLALAMGYAPVSLGNSRLRTETAGVVATQIIADIEALKTRE